MGPDPKYRTDFKRDCMEVQYIIAVMVSTKLLLFEIFIPLCDTILWG